MPKMTGMYIVESTYLVGEENYLEGCEVFPSIDQAASKAENLVQSQEVEFTVYKLVPVLKVKVGKPIRELINDV